MGYLDGASVQPLKLSVELKKRNRFRIAIFGSARIKRDDQIYRDVFDLARRIGDRGFDMVTGGGPGIMEAANAGHEFGDSQDVAESIGLIIELPFENKGNNYLELSKRFKRFSKRLDTFLSLSNVMVVTRGGIGTMLELFYMWQHVQVHHVSFKPIILIGEMWEELIQWIKDYALRDRLVSEEDFDYIYIAKNNEQAMDIINTFKKLHDAEGKMRKIICDPNDGCSIPPLETQKQEEPYVTPQIQPKISMKDVKDKIVLIKKSLGQK
jgi:uncharacterized protein (TIGR00730 family)